MHKDKGKRNHGKFFGVLFIVLGVIFLLKSFNIFDFSFLNFLRVYWPLGIIILGISLILNKKVFFALLFIMLIIGGFFLFEGFNYDSETKMRETVLKVPYEEGINYTNLDIDYGVGEVRIFKGDNSSYILRNNVKTNDINDPFIKSERKNNEAYISMERNHRKGLSSLSNVKESWDIGLSEDIIYSIKMDYGVTDMEIDLKELKVDELEIDSGVSSTRVIFGNYPTKVNVETGVSSTELYFPKDAGVKIYVESGLSSLDLDDFSKKDEIYYSENYDSSKDNIEIYFEAGVSDMNVEFY